MPDKLPKARRLFTEKLRTILKSCSEQCRKSTVQFKIKDALMQIMNRALRYTMHCLCLLIALETASSTWRAIQLDLKANWILTTPVQDPSSFPSFITARMSRSTLEKLACVVTEGRYRTHTENRLISRWDSIHIVYVRDFTRWYLDAWKRASVRIVRWYNP